jgi:CubicO group peptidase (beta-lactamase class C family)
VESLIGAARAQTGGSRLATLQAGTVPIVPSVAHPLDPALAAVAQWPVGHVAVGARGPDGSTAVAGLHDRPFPLASVSKVLTAVTVLIAAEEGSLDLDEPATGVRNATVRDLLCHASGLAFDSDTVIAPPRRKRIYSNVGFEHLGALVASRTAMAFADYAREAVCEPLGMAATTMEGSPAADAVSTVDDLLRFTAGLPSLLSATTLAAMATPQYPDLDGVLPGFGQQHPNPWGLGPEIRGHKTPHWTGAANSPRTWGHFGRAGTFLWVDPDAQVTLVALTDRDFGPWAIEGWPALADAVLAAAGTT